MPCQPLLIDGKRPRKDTAPGRARMRERDRLRRGEPNRKRLLFKQKPRRRLQGKQKVQVSGLVEEDKALGGGDGKQLQGNGQLPGLYLQVSKQRWARGDSNQEKGARCFHTSG